MSVFSGNWPPIFRDLCSSTANCAPARLARVWRSPKKALVGVPVVVGEEQVVWSATLALPANYPTSILIPIPSRKRRLASRPDHRTNR